MNKSPRSPLCYILLCFALLLACPGLLAAEPMTAPGERSWLDDSHIDKAAEMQLRHRWLMSNHDKAAVAARVVDVSADRWAEISEHDRRVGVVADTDVSFSAVRSFLDKGGPDALRAVDGGYVWTGAVEVPGATAIRPMFRNLVLPEGAELYVYNRTGEAFGPYTGTKAGDFWANTVTGSELLIQVRMTGRLDKALLAGFELAGVGAMDDSFLFGKLATESANGQSTDKAFCSFNADCVNNAECQSIPSAIQPAQDAIGEMLFPSGAYLYICTGGLIADSDDGTQIPYFLTANHCISKNNEASGLEVFFQFTTPCNGSCYDFQTAGLPRTLGASIESTNKNSDYTLLRLDEAAPAGSYFLGWDATDIAFDDGTQLHRISHPGGAPQAYSRHEVTTPPFECFQTDRGDWIYEDDVEGATEGGSSGSPVLNDAGLVVGQLTGACGDNYDDVCDSASNRTIDGALAAYYSNVADILGGGGSCTDADLDGHCASEDCDDNDGDVNPGAAEICDGIDNDCDGSVDEGCGMCLPKGDACVDDADCCSNKCKGPSGRKTCK